MAYRIMAYIDRAYEVMAYTTMACTATAYIVMACIATAYVVMATKTRGGRDEEQRRKHKRPEVERERKERHLQLLPQRERFLVSRHVQVHTVLADGGEERGVTQALRRDPEVRDRNVEPADANIVGGWKSGACERTVRCVAVRCGAVPCGAIVSLHPSQIHMCPGNRIGYRLIATKGLHQL